MLGGSVKKEARNEKMWGQKEQDGGELSVYNVRFHSYFVRAWTVKCQDSVLRLCLDAPRHEMCIIARPPSCRHVAPGRPSDTTKCG